MLSARIIERHENLTYNDTLNELSMKVNKNKIKEPYPPDKTPFPPQIIDPKQQNEEDQDVPVENRKRPENAAGQNTDKEKSKQLGDETEINDELQSDI